MTVNSRTLLNNRYQIIKTLGRGGFGETFLAIDTHLPSQKKCVIKQLKPVIQEPTIPRWMCDRFKQEARILESLGDKHRQIPQLYAYFQEGQNFFLVQEWIDGITLTQKVEQEGVLSPEQVENILQKLLPVLSYIHGQNIIHRDLKPDNIIYRHQDQCPVLIDFGAVKEAITEVQQNMGKSAYSIAIGTPGYMPNEQAAGRPMYSSDLYSLGLTAIYLLTGKTPQQLQINLKTGEFMWRRELPSLHSGLASVIDRAIRFNPRERFATAEEMLLSLSPDNSTQAQINDDSSFSQVPTKAVIGRANSELNFPLTTTKPTLNITSDSQDQTLTKERHFRIPLWLLFLLLPVMAITSFFVGYQLWKQVENNDRNTEIAREQTSEEQSTGEISPAQESETNVKEKEDNSQSTEEQNSSNSSPSSEEDNNSGNINSDELKPSEELEDEPETISPIGLSARELNRRWGKPSYQDSAYNNRVTIVAYNNPFPRIEQVKYLVSNESKQVVQIDLLVSSKMPTRLISRLMNRTFNQQMSDEAKYAISEVLTGQTDLRSFYLGEYQGMVQRRNQLVEIRVWDRKFSF